MKGIKENRDILHKMKLDVLYYKCILECQIESLEEVLSLVHEINYNTTYINCTLQNVISKLKDVVNGNNENI